MSIITSDKFDISTLSKDTQYVVDTNVLYFIHSGYKVSKHKSTTYSNIVSTILNQGCKLIISTLSVQELLHIIEKKEYRIFCDNNGKDPKHYTKKDFRQNLVERNKLKAKLQVVLCELSTYYSLDDAEITNVRINDFINAYEMHRLDVIDYFLIKNYDKEKTVFISDDKDFQSVSEINVLVAV